MSTYQPGTVAVANVRGVPDVRVFRSGSGWQTPEAWVSDTGVTDVHPLVVLDLDGAYGCHAEPRDPAKIVAALRATYSVAAHGIADQIEAQTKPPRIPEPGLWGVVEASSGGLSARREYVRYPDGWRGDVYEAQPWSHLVDPALVREGVES